MTVSRINMRSLHNYIGHSGDIKPLKGAGAGSTFYEVDTGASFIWSDGVWENDLRIFYAVSEAIKQS